MGIEGENVAVSGRETERGERERQPTFLDVAENAHGRVDRSDSLV